MTVSEALDVVDEMNACGGEIIYQDGAAEAAIVLAAEVRRLRKETFELVKDLLAGTPEGDRNR